MSMTYYAVTDDPNELAHWGIKGMKWGVRRTDAQLGHPRHTGSRRPRSAAYKKAQSKLSKMMKSGIKKAEAHWKVYNSPQAKYERQTNKAIQLARKGKLKYGKLTDDQVRRVTERLDLERQARQLSNQEQTFRHRLAKSISEGVVTGIGQGFGRRASEFIARGSILKTDRLRSEQQDELDRRKEKRRMRNAEREANKKAEREFKQQQRKDDYEFSRDQERERRKLSERGANEYLYGAKYDNDGKLLNAGDLYNQKHIKKKTLQLESVERSSAEARQKVISAQNEMKRLEAARQRDNERLERQRAVERQAEIERQRKAKSQMAAEADRLRSSREKEQAWQSKQKRIAEAHDRDTYRSNVQRLAGESGKHSKTTSGWRSMDRMENGVSNARSSSWGDISYSTARRRKRSRKGKS